MGRVPRTPEQRRPADKHAKPASADQIVRLLNERLGEVCQALGLDPGNANLSFRTDERGARIRVSIRPHVTQNVPASITLAIDKEPLSVPVEVDTDFQEFQPLESRQGGRL